MEQNSLNVILRCLFISGSTKWLNEILFTSILAASPFQLRFPI